MATKMLCIYCWGALFAVIYEAQPLWLPGLLPLVIFRIWQQKRWYKTAGFTVSALAVFSAFKMYKTTLPQVHNPAVFSTKHIVEHCCRIPQFLFDNQQGAYFFDYLTAPNPFTFTFAIAFSAITYLLIIAMLRCLYHKNCSALYFSATLSIVCTLACTVFITEEHPRYLLPVTGFTLFTLQLFLNGIRQQKKLHFSIAALTLWAGIALFSIRNFSFCKITKKELTTAIRLTLDNNVHHVYATWMLQWQLMFYSNGAIIARQKWIPDRCPEFNKSVDKALYMHKPVGIITESDFNTHLTFPAPTVKLPNLYIYLTPSRELLKANFQLWSYDSFFPAGN